MIKIGLRGAPPLTSLALRFWIAALLVFVMVRVRGKPIPHDRSFLAFSVFLGLFHIAFPYSLVYWAEQHITSSLTAVLYATMPLMVAMLARVFLGNPLTAAKISGIAFGLAGVTVIYSDRLGWGGENNGLGVDAVLVSVFFASLSTVALKKRGHNIDPMAGLLIPFLVAATVTSIAGCILEGVNPLHLDALTWGTVFYLGFLGSFVAFGLYFWAIQRMDVTTLSYQSFIIPVLALLFGWIIIDEAISRRVALGTLLILTGIALANLRQLRKRLRGQARAV
jgi:drug/metabolite transporter (DMT)-like permease